MPSSPLIAVLSAHRHPRLRYVLREIGRAWGWRVRLFTDEARFTAAGADGRLVYGERETTVGAVHLPAHRFLGGSHPTEDNLAVTYAEDVPCFFNTPAGTDLLACIFYALSRYEEYQPFEPDGHGRFPATESHALRNGYLHLPVVRIWAARLAGRLLEEHPQLPAPVQPDFTVQPTYDIDLPWAYQHRGWRGVASGVKDAATGQLSRAKARFSGAEDPFFTLNYLLGLHPDTEPTIFWLLADNEVREDVNPYPIPEEQTALMRSLENHALHGIHPGYASAETEGKLKAEVNRYRQVFGVIPQHSRQHFLRLRFPSTYRALRLNGITHDHSMGYGDAIGWRAGTNLPFRWYDLEMEEMTGLTVHPFAAMDVTLKNYLSLEPQEAIAAVHHLMEAVKPYGGPFPLLWHNSSFADDFGWHGWRRVYETLIST